MKLPKKFWYVFSPLLAVLVITTVLGVFYTAHKKKPAVVAAKAPSTQNQVKKDEQKPTESTKTDVPAQTEPSAKSATSTTAKTTTTKTVSPAPVITPPSIPAFKITSISMNGAMCINSGGSIITYINTAYFVASNAQGGTFTWMIDGYNDTETISSAPRTETIPSNQSWFTASGSTPSSPGFLYTDMDAKPGEHIRVKTTSPNVTYSQWFVVPESGVCS